MKKFTYIFLAIIALVMAGGLGYYFGYDVGMEKSIPEPITTDNGDNNPELSQKFSTDTLKIDQPAIGATIKSPLTVTGEATGRWYFEASFPIEIVSPDGIQLGQSFVQAQDDWMTENLVPFEGQIIFNSQDYTEGFLVFHRDNPSGLPEFDASEQIPVKFAP